MATPQIPNNPLNYMLPSALSIWFAPLQDDGSLGSWTDLGNVSEVALNLTDTYLDHMSARNGLSTKDKTAITEVDATVNFTIDELVGCNLAYIFRPQTAIDTSATYTVLDQKRHRLSGTTAVVIDPIAVECSTTDFVDLGYGGTSGVILVRSTDGVTTYVDGVDYTFTQAAGSGTGRTAATIARIALGSISDNSEVLVTYEYDRDTTEYKLQEGSVAEGVLRVQALNRIGPLFAYEFGFVSLKIDGETALNPAEYMKQAMIAQVLTAGDGSRGSFHIFDCFQRLSAGLTC